MTRVNTRSSQVREANERAQTEYVFEEPNQTQIPKEVEEKFKNSGMTLGWLRIDLKDKEAKDCSSVGTCAAIDITLAISFDILELNIRFLVTDSKPWGLNSNKLSGSTFWLKFFSITLAT